MSSETSVQLPEVSNLKERLLQLQKSLQEASPSYESHLFTIHQALKNNPDFTHLLTPDEVSLIVKGLEKKTGVIITAESSGKAASTAKLKKLSADDI